MHRPAAKDRRWTRQPKPGFNFGFKAITFFCRNQNCPQKSLEKISQN